MKLAHTNRFVALKNELGRDNRNFIRPTRLSATQTLKVRRPFTRLVARWHVCPKTRRLECAWSVEPVACDGQLWRSRARMRSFKRPRLLRSPAGNSDWPTRATRKACLPVGCRQSAPEGLRVPWAHRADCR